MIAKVRNLGRRGIAAMAISAVDAALWDWKCKLRGIPLVALLGQVRDAVPVYTAAASPRRRSTNYNASSRVGSA